MNLNGGTVHDADSQACTLTLPAPGAGGSLSTQATIAVDAVGPTVTITGPASTVTSPTIPFTVTCSRPVTGLSQSSFQLTGATAVSLTGSGASYTLTVSASAIGTVSVALSASAASDGAGLGSLAGSVARSSSRAAARPRPGQPPREPPRLAPARGAAGAAPPAPPLAGRPQAAAAAVAAAAAWVRRARSSRWGCWRAGDASASAAPDAAQSIREADAEAGGDWPDTQARCRDYSGSGESRPAVAARAWNSRGPASRVDRRPRAASRGRSICSLCACSATPPTPRTRSNRAYPQALAFQGERLATMPSAGSSPWWRTRRDASATAAAAAPSAFSVRSAEACARGPGRRRSRRAPAPRGDQRPRRQVPHRHRHALSDGHELRPGGRDPAHAARARAAACQPRHRQAARVHGAQRLANRGRAGRRLAGGGAAPVRPGGHLLRHRRHRERASAHAPARGGAARAADRAWHHRARGGCGGAGPRRRGGLPPHRGGAGRHLRTSGASGHRPAPRDAPAAAAATPAGRFLATTVAYCYRHDEGSAWSATSSWAAAWPRASPCACRCRLRGWDRSTPADRPRRACARLARARGPGAVHRARRGGAVAPALAADLAAWRRDLADADPRTRSGAVVALEETWGTAPPLGLRSPARSRMRMLVADLAPDSLARYADVLPWADQRAAIASAVADASTRPEPLWRSRALSSPGAAGWRRSMASPSSARAWGADAADDVREPAEAPCAPGPRSHRRAVGARRGRIRGRARHGRTQRHHLCGSRRAGRVERGRALCLPLACCAPTGPPARTPTTPSAWPRPRRTSAPGGGWARLARPPPRRHWRRRRATLEPTVRARRPRHGREPHGFLRRCARRPGRARSRDHRAPRRCGPWAIRAAPESTASRRRCRAMPGSASPPALARSRQHPGEVAIVASGSAAFSNQRGIVVDTVSSDGNVAARDVLRASSAAAPTP